MCSYNKLHKSALAGFEQKNDLVVKVSAAAPGSGIQIDLASPVMHQFGEHIENLVLRTVTEAGFQDVILQINDQGAWDYTITARVLAALERGMQNE